jgi:MFS family permease
MRDPGVRRARLAVSAYFFVMGMVAGVWMARIPAVKAQAGLSDGALGLALFAIPVGLVLGAALAERLVDRVGSAVVVRTAGIGNCLLVVAPGVARNLPELMAALLVFGVTGGTADVAQNAQGVRVEAAYGRPVMTSLHSFFSLGAMAGALGGGGLAWAGVAPLPSFAAAAVAGALVDGGAARWLLRGLPGGDETGKDAPRDRPEAPAVRDAAGPAAAAAPAEARRVRRLIIALGVLGICGMMGEGAAGDWSAVYLKDNLGTSAGFAALAFAAFSVTMTAGRAVGDRLIHRFGIVPVVRCGGLLAAAGLAGALVTASPGAVVAGFAVFGAGLSVVVPQVFAAGGRADPARPGSGLAKVVGLGYAGQSAGPAVIGAAASRTGLHLALAIPVLLALWIAAGAPALGTRANTRRVGRDGGGEGTGTFGMNARGASENGQLLAYGKHMDDKEILTRISGLLETERDLRSQLAAGKLSSEQERERLRSAEEALDQCWDLLRQRRARREFGENPDEAAVRPAAEVEGYQQ